MYNYYLSEESRDENCLLLIRQTYTEQKLQSSMLYKLSICCIFIVASHIWLYLIHTAGKVKQVVFLNFIFQLWKLRLPEILLY